MWFHVFSHIRRNHIFQIIEVIEANSGHSSRVIIRERALPRSTGHMICSEGWYGELRGRTPEIPFANYSETDG